MKITKKNNIVDKIKFPQVRLGLCCMIISLRYNELIYSSRRKTANVILKKGIADAKENAIANVIDLAKMILWAKNHGIDVMRISSELIPHSTNKKIIEHFGEEGKSYESLEFLRPYLQKIGYIAKKEKMRLTAHPGHFVKIGSPDKIVYENSIKDLDMHVKFMEMMDLDKESVLVIHIGGTYCDKKGSIIRFKEQFNMMPAKIKNRIVLENDEKCYDAEDVLNICEDLKVPMVFDIFHYYCYKKYHPNTIQKTIPELLPRILKTWEEKNIRPKFHVSEQAPVGPVGAHSFLVENIPIELLEIPLKYNINVDIMIEAKGKEYALGHLYKKYPNLKAPYTDPIPSTIPKKAYKDLNIPDDIMKCECE